MPTKEEITRVAKEIYDDWRGTELIFATPEHGIYHQSWENATEGQRSTFESFAEQAIEAIDAMRAGEPERDIRVPALKQIDEEPTPEGDPQDGI